MQHYSSWKNNEAFDCYKTYLALKRHFSSDTYDYFKYNGKVPASIKSFEARRDAPMFARLAKQPEWKLLLLANLSEDPDTWVGKMLDPEAEQKKVEMQRIHGALLYYYSEEIKKDVFLKEFDQNFIPKEGQHPPLLENFLSNQISLQTMVILDELVNYVPKWDKLINETFVWPKIRRKIVKFKPFISIEKSKFRKKTLDCIQ